MYTAKTLALMLATSISIVAIILLFLILPMDIKIALLTSGVIFFVTFSLVFFGLRQTLFNKMSKICEKLDERLSKELKQNTTRKQRLLGNPLQNINDSIDSFATLKQREIDNLKKLEMFRTEFVADVSHELKTPIFAAQGFIHTLLDGAINDENVRIKFLKKAAKNLDGLNALVQDLLILSQIEMGHVKMKFNNIDLYRLCLEVAEQFEQRKGKQLIVIQPPPSGQMLIVRADWTRISQVMTNLISNAIKYTYNKGSVTIRFEIDKEFVTTFVADTGMGIPPNHINHIFQRFYRVEKSRSKEKGGTGLGLSIVKHILEEHGSKANVESKVDKGSVFRFKLRIAGV